MNINLATIIIINFRVLAIKIPKIDFISAFWFLTLYFGKTISPVRKRLISFPVRRRIAACRRPARGSSGCYFRSLFFSSLSLSLACLSWAPSSFLDFSLYPLSRLRIYSRPLLQFVFISVACNSSLSAFERFLSFFLSLSLSLSLSLFGWWRNKLLRVRFLPSSLFLFLRLWFLKEYGRLVESFFLCREECSCEEGSFRTLFGEEILEGQWRRRRQHLRPGVSGAWNWRTSVFLVSPRFWSTPPLLRLFSTFCREILFSFRVWSCRSFFFLFCFVSICFRDELLSFVVKISKLLVE